jgi:hypothetical protein
MPAAAETPRFGPRDVAVVTGQQDEILVVRPTPPTPKTVVVRATPPSTKDILTTTQEEENPYFLPASTAPSLLTSSRRIGEPVDFHTIGRRSK